jgi:sugar lactone lactonase YvrE
MYLADTHASRNLVWAFDYDVDNGTPHNRRVFVDFAGSGGRPDGATTDTDGCYWVAATGAGEVRRYTPQGQLDLAIALPVTHPTMPVFAGDDLGTLFVTTLRHPDVAEAAPDGGLFRLRVAQRGIMETFYAQ